jgi:hypothetical protein
LIAIHEPVEFLVYLCPRLSDFVVAINMRMISLSELPENKRKVNGINEDNKECGWKNQESL